MRTRIALPNVEGRIDHFSVDLQGNRLFMAALGNRSIEVLDVAERQTYPHHRGRRGTAGSVLRPDIESSLRRHTTGRNRQGVRWW